MKALDKIRQQAFYYDAVSKSYTPAFDDALRVTDHQDRGVKLMREAIDLPYMSDQKAWEAWCQDWARRAQAWVAEAQQ